MTFSWRQAASASGESSIRAATCCVKIGTLSLPRIALVSEVMLRFLLTCRGTFVDTQIWIFVHLCFWIVPFN